MLVCLMVLINQKLTVFLSESCKEILSQPTDKEQKKASRLKLIETKQKTGFCNRREIVNTKFSLNLYKHIK